MPAFREIAMRALGTVLAGAAVAAAAGDALEPREIAKDVYAFIGDGTEATAENRGFAANAGFIVGTTGVTVIDTGASRRHGRRMLDAIARVTPRPVRQVINTHAVQEFIFGNGAFKDAGISILAHRATVDLMRTRCNQCLERLRPLLGGELRGTTLVLPDNQVDAGTVIHAGGRRLELLHGGWAATPGDIAVFDRASGTLFAGGLVVSGRIPEIRDSHFEGWLEMLDRLKHLGATHVVPGFGPPGGAEVIAGTEAYLRALDARMRELYAHSTSLLESVDQAGLPAYAAWKLYPEAHRRNAQHRYLQLEVLDLGGDPRSVVMPRE